MQMIFNDQVKSPLPYYGGKTSLIDFILPYFPAHNVYCEPFGGSAAVLLAKPASATEVYNDLHVGMATFFRVLKDSDSCAELARRLALTPNSRREHRECHNSYPAQDPIECARQVYVLIRQSFSAIFDHSWGYRISASEDSFASAIDSLLPASQRLRHVQVENLHFAQMFDKYDSANTLWYLDPPYLGETRVAKSAYRHEMSRTEHELLLSRIVRLNGMVLLSGYASQLYAQALGGWRCVTKSIRCYSSPNRSKPNRVEHLWLNPRAAERQVCHRRAADLAPIGTGAAA